MRTTAALVRSAGKPFTIEHVDLEEPNDDEVLVRVSAAGLSHIDLLARDQGYPTPCRPCWDVRPRERSCGRAHA